MLLGRMANVSIHTGYQPVAALPQVNSPIVAEKRRGAFTEALKSNTPSPTKPTPAKKSKSDADSYLDDVFDNIPDARGNFAAEYEPGKSDQRSSPAGAYGLKDDREFLASPTYVSANGWDGPSSSDGVQRLTGGKGKGTRALNFENAVSNDATGGSSSGANANDIANISSTLGGAMSSPLSSKTQYFRIDSENLDLEGELRREMSRKEEEAQKSRGELEAKYRAMLSSLSDEKDMHIASLCREIDLQRTINADSREEANSEGIALRRSSRNAQELASKSIKEEYAYEMSWKTELENARNVAKAVSWCC